MNFELLPESLSFDPATFDFARIPPGAGVFALETGGEPYLGKSAALRRRLEKLLAENPAGKESKRLNLRGVTRAIHFRSTGSAFETSLLLYRALRAAFPARYQSLLRLRPPPLLRVNLTNAWPRCTITRRLGRPSNVYYGPFPSRAAAEKFSAEFLDLFLVRRCVEELRPDPAHPGCIYGEMRMCLRPCQDATTAERYGMEVRELVSFLSTTGVSLLTATQAARDRAAAELNFEEAARIHKRLEKIEHAVKESPGLARDLENLHGVVIQPSAAGIAHGVELFPVWRGFLQPQVSLSFEVMEGKPVSMDARVREALATALPHAGTARSGTRTRGEHLALLSRWYHRGTRKGEWVPIENFDRLPVRRIVGAISRIARGQQDG